MGRGQLLETRSAAQTGSESSASAARGQVSLVSRWTTILVVQRKSSQSASKSSVRRQLLMISTSIFNLRAYLLESSRSYLARQTHNDSNMNRAQVNERESWHVFSVRSRWKNWITGQLQREQIATASPIGRFVCCSLVLNLFHFVSFVLSLACLFSGTNSNADAAHFLPLHVVVCRIVVVVSAIN